MDLFTIGGDGVLARCGTPDLIMAWSTDHLVASLVLCQVEVVVSQPATNRICPMAVAEEEVARRPAEDHVGAGAPGDPVLSATAPDGVGALTAVEKVICVAAADVVVTPTRDDAVGPPPAEDDIRAGQRVNGVVPAEASDRVRDRGPPQVVVPTGAVQCPARWREPPAPDSPPPTQRRSPPTPALYACSPPTSSLRSSPR
jgi:hypothetical protein